MEDYVYWAITGGVGLLVGAVTYLLKRGLDRTERRIEENEEHTRAIEGKLNKTIGEMPFLYTLREDFIRANASHERKLDRGGEPREQLLRDGGVRVVALTQVAGKSTG